MHNTREENTATEKYTSLTIHKEFHDLQAYQKNVRLRVCNKQSICTENRDINSNVWRKQRKTKMFKIIYIMKIGCTTNKLSFTERTSSEYITLKYKPSAREP